MKEIISYGGGTQSTALILMALEGKFGLERPDFAVFSDTGCEPEFIYDYVDYFTKYCREKYGFEIYTIRKNGPSLVEKLTSVPARERAGTFYVSSVPPFYTLNSDGTSGMLMRQCTSDYKTHPTNSFIKKTIGRKEQFRLWLGISFDERSRMRVSTDKRRINYYPLVENYVRRKDSIDFVVSIGVRRPFRSSCYFCPFHSDKYWKWAKAEHPAVFKKACGIEYSVQNISLKTQENSIIKSIPFLHRSCKPLAEIDFDTDTQLDMFPELIDECEGYCGI